MHTTSEMMYMIVCLYHFMHLLPAIINKFPIIYLTKKNHFTFVYFVISILTLSSFAIIIIPTWRLKLMRRCAH